VGAIVSAHRATSNRRVVTRVAGVAAAGALLLAGPAAIASADPLSGSYTVTPSGGRFNGAFNVTMTPCGPDCTQMLNAGGKVTELHLQGNNWTGTQAYSFKGLNCTTTYTFDKDSLVGSNPIVCDVNETRSIVLTKNG
jgi:hypothetical protein